MNSKPQDASNAKLTDHLKALLLGGALAIASAQTSSAAQAPQPKTIDSLDARIQKLRDQIRENPDASFRTGEGPAADGSDLMWWRNAWGNGGWHNWHNGWRNGGWGNWHNW